MGKQIKVEYKGYHIISSGSVGMSMSHAHIIKPDGDILCHLNLACKPTKEVLKDALEYVVNKGVKDNAKKED